MLRSKCVFTSFRTSTSNGSNIERHDALHATVDDWKRFVNGVYLAWRRKMSNVDLRCIHPDGLLAIRDYIEQTYSFARFMTSAPEFQELQRLDATKFE